MHYRTANPIHCKTAERHEDALGSDVIAELDGTAAARHNVPRSLNPYDGIYAEIWDKGYDYALGLLPFQQ